MLLCLLEKEKIKFYLKEININKKNNMGDKMEYVRPEEIDLKREEKIINKEELTYKLYRGASYPVLKQMYKPLIVNQENFIKEKDVPVIYTPNHTKTRDSIVLFNQLPDEVHFMALYRFFTGEDSIFNNSKHPFAREFTKHFFPAIGQIPIVRPQDKEFYPDFNNKEWLLVVKRYLELGKSVGIFPEGTTSGKEKETDLLAPEKTAFSLARKTDAYIQPLSIVYRPEESDFYYKTIVNVRPAFKVSKSPVDAMRQWEESVKEGIDENLNMYQKTKSKKRR